MNPIEIFRAGRHTPMRGDPLSFSEADVAAMAAAYDPALSEAPIVVGHPKADAPAYGWIRSLSAEGGRLFASPDQVEPSFAEMVRAGRYKKLSASLYAPDSPANPRPGAWYLRHVGFLGAQPPAIKGLSPVSFAAGDEDGLFTVEFCEIGKEPESPKEIPMDSPVNVFNPTEREAELARREQELARREAEFAESQRRAEAETFISAAVTEGRLTPAQSAGLADFMASLSVEGVFEFAEGDGRQKASPADFMKDFISRLPKQVDFSEKSAPTDDPDELDPREAAARAVAFQERRRSAGIVVTTTEAIAAVKAGKDR